jgi:hypothetical protein
MSTSSMPLVDQLQLLVAVGKVGQAGVCRAGYSMTVKVEL